MTSEDALNGLTIADLIRHVIERDELSFAKLCQRARERNLDYLTSPVLSLIWRGELKEYPKPRTIEALAAALNVSYGTVLNACTLQLGRPHIWHGPGATVIVDDEITPGTARELERRVRRAARGK